MKSILSMQVVGVQEDVEWKVKGPIISTNPVQIQNQSLVFVSSTHLIQNSDKSFFFRGLTWKLDKYYNNPMWNFMFAYWICSQRVCKYKSTPSNTIHPFTAYSPPPTYFYDNIIFILNITGYFCNF